MIQTLQKLAFNLVANTSKNKLIHLKTVILYDVLLLYFYVHFFFSVGFSYLSN